MSVTFNRAQLIKVTTAALAAHDRAAGERAKQVEKYKVDHARTAITTTQEHARRLRDALTKALKANRPVTIAELSAALGGTTSIRDRFYADPGDYEINRALENVPLGLMKPSEVVESRALLKVLTAATGDEVSVNELKLLGLKNLQPVFVAAAQG